MDASPCPFCPPSGDRMLARAEHAVALWDGYPVSPGHALVVPRRHVTTWFEADPDERADIVRLIDEVRAIVLERHAPDGWNVGMNLGEAAGQTVGHLHVHVIPRYSGDVRDPRGGVRWVIPGKADYWSGT